MPRGNPNPSPATRFKPGQTANPGGKTKEQKRIEIENAERAMRIRDRFLPWRGTEEEARKLAERLTYIKEERDRRRSEADEYMRRECAASIRLELCSGPTARSSIGMASNCAPSTRKPRSPTSAASFTGATGSHYGWQST